MAPPRAASGGNLRLASNPLAPASGRVDRNALDQQRGAAVDQTSATPSQRPADVSESRQHSLRDNHAEREVRPAVIIRKNSYGNRSEVGADAQAVLMTVFRTLKLRGHHPILTIVQALRVYVKPTNSRPFLN
ncbi:MAG: transposase [Planctomycetes bacterium]|nr:transposase [Planctomycetota bacterium]